MGHEHDLEAVSVSRIVVSFEIFCFIFGKFCLGSFGIGFISKKQLQYQWWQGLTTIRLECDKNENLETMRKMLQPAPMHYIALCCYPNVNGAIKNLSLNTSTAPIFCNQWFRKKYLCLFLLLIYVQFHFLCIFVGRVDRIHKTTNLTMFF